MSASKMMNATGYLVVRTDGTMRILKSSNIRREHFSHCACRRGWIDAAVR
jgi:hypothetical protein